VPALLIPGWSGYSPEVRATVAELLLGQEPWAFELLKAVEAKQVAAVDLDAARRQRLLESGSARVKALAQTLLVGEAGTSRQKVVDARRSVLDMTGDAKRGKVVFAQNCAVCHRAGDLGAELGPDLRSVGGWSPDAILTAVLDPNRAVEPRFIAYDAKLADGASVFGVVTAETGNSITMKGLDGKERPILRGEIRSLASTGRSLMPDGLEAAIDKQGLADLIAFVKDPAAAR
jgi:putative heme-binding domain-containing protein